MYKTKRAFIGNIVLFVLEVFATAWIMSGISAAGGPLDGPNYESLKYYTVDSNILMGIAALVAAVAQWRVMKGKAREVPRWTLVLTLAGTVSVTLTMLITIFFLGPTIGRVYGFFSLFANSSLFLHLINPVTAIFVFLRYERSDRIPFRLTPLAILPTVLYAVYYVALTLQHITNGAVEAGYDWYGFFAFGIDIWWLVVAVILLITYGITLLLWRLNRSRAQS
ncbi:MAG: hypothetical protein J6U01_02075 [Clostridia bacterium]|nr:hypothetical protein [Clostridia bacterium]